MAPTRLRLDAGQRVDRADYLQQYARTVIRQPGGASENVCAHLRNFGAALLGDRAASNRIIDREIDAWDDAW